MTTSLTRPMRWLALLSLTLTLACGQQTPVVLSDEIQDPVALAADENSVYWLQADGVLAKVPRKGGPRVELAPRLADPNPLPLVRSGSIVADRETVYFATFCMEAGMPTGVVWAVPRDGGTPKILASYPGETVLLAVDDARVYALHAEPFHSRGGIDVFSKRINYRAKVADVRYATGLAVDDFNVYWFDTEDGPGGTGPQALWTCSHSGGPATILARDLRSPTRLYYQGYARSLWWLDEGSYTTVGDGPFKFSNGDGTLSRLSLHSEDHVALKNFATGLEDPHGFAVMDGEAAVVYAESTQLYRLDVNDPYAEPAKQLDSPSWDPPEYPVLSGVHMFWINAEQVGGTRTTRLLTQEVSPF